MTKAVRLALVALLAPLVVLAASPALGAEVVYSVPTSDKVAFITIDDGVYADPAALKTVQSRQVPVTAFLTAWTVPRSLNYFKKITEFGSVQNHSATHAWFTDPRTDLDHEICYTQRMLAKKFSLRPTLLRPPYGAGSQDKAVHSAAERCGIEKVVMWNATVNNGKVTRPGGKLRPGDIIILHFTKNLDKDVKAALAQMKRDGLKPASLLDYLN